MSFYFCGTFPVARLTAEACKGTIYKRYGDKVTYYDMKDLSLVQSYVTRLQPEDVKWVEISTDDLRPHRDHGVTAALNLYVDPAFATTQFWAVKEGQQPYAYPGEAMANLYREEQLEPTDSFIARTGDAYWLDLTQVHTVRGAIGKRKFVQFSWSTRTLADILRRK